VGALSHYERLKIERHLHGCASCRAELASLVRTTQLLQPMPRADAPPQVWAHVARNLTPRHASRRLVVRERPNWTPVFAVAALVLIVALAVVLPLIHGHTPGGTPQVAYADLHLAASWDAPLSDKAALGLAALASESSDPLQSLQEDPD
jgi:anti-sigma-K factor RskA